MAATFFALTVIFFRLAFILFSLAIMIMPMANNNLPPDPVPGKFATCGLAQQKKHPINIGRFRVLGAGLGVMA